MNAFITGSHAYGTPSSLSDIDLVILVKGSTLGFLLEQSDLGTTPVRYGKLNLIMTDDPDAFRLWRECTNYLKSKAPVNKETAKVYLEAKFEEAGLKRFFCNSGDDDTPIKG